MIPACSIFVWWMFGDVLAFVRRFWLRCVFSASDIPLGTRNINDLWPKSD